MKQSLLIAVLIGILQGIFEWLPISSEGNITVALSALNYSPKAAVSFALFLHLGTALSATLYYRDELREVLSLLPTWRPRSAFEDEHAFVSFLAIGTVVSGVVGLTAYATLEHVVSALTGGAVVILIGGLLVVTGLFQRVSNRSDGRLRSDPTLGDAVLVGIAQGTAILPGISRSGMTTGVLLLRGHNGTDSFHYSFLLSIPAALGGGLLAFLDTGLAGVSPLAAGVAVLTSAVVGYATIDALLRVVERISFWAVCIGLGMLSVIGGLFLL